MFQIRYTDILPAKVTNDKITIKQDTITKHCELWTSEIQLLWNSFVIQDTCLLETSLNHLWDVDSSHQHDYKLKMANNQKMYVTVITLIKFIFSFIIAWLPGVMFLVSTNLIWIFLYCFMNFYFKRFCCTSI